MKEKNPFLDDVELQGLLDNLSRNAPGAVSGQFVDYEPQRMQAMIQQANNLRDAAVRHLQTVGALSIAAADAKESSHPNWQDVGYLTQWLAEMVAVCNLFESNARFTIEDPENAKKIAMSSAGIHPDQPKPN